MLSHPHTSNVRAAAQAEAGSYDLPPLQTSHMQSMLIQHSRLVSLVCLILQCRRHALPDNIAIAHVLWISSWLLARLLSHSNCCMQRDQPAVHMVTKGSKKLKYISCYTAHLLQFISLTMKSKRERPLAISISEPLLLYTSRLDIHYA